MRTWGRTWHLIFLAHVWAMSPFAFLWLYDPGVARDLPATNMAAMHRFTFGVLIYFAVRTILAFKNPPWLRWEYVYPPIDVLLITLMLGVGERDPLGNITVMYFLPIAEAAGTLNVVYAAAIGVLSIGGCLLGSVGHVNDKPFNIAFRFIFLVVMASLVTFLARRAAEFRGRAQVAADRNRLALEMHDGVQAQLISAASQMELVQHLATKDGARASEIATESRATLRQAADELRFLVQRLRAPALGEGFLPALHQYAHNFCERFGLSLAFETDGTSSSFTAEQENALFRIAQESLTNIVKHAGATSVNVCVKFSADDVRLIITDDGCGIAQDRVGIGNVGMEGMLERAKGVGGILTMKSDGDRGTTVDATIPFGKRMKTVV